MENTKLPISNTREYSKSSDHGDQSLGEERKFLRQDDKERPEGRGLQYSQGRKSPLMFPSKIEKIHSTDIISEAVNHSDLHLSINNFTVNPSVGIEVAPHWTQVPVTDTDEDNSHLPACLYSKKGNAAQIEFDLKSKLSSNTDTEAELRPSVLENLDTSGLNFIPVLHISPVTSPTSTAAKPGNKCTEEGKDANGQNTETGAKAKEEDIHIASPSGLTKDLDNFNRYLRDNTSTPLGRSLAATTSDGNLKGSTGGPSVDHINATPLHRTILSRLESTPEGAMMSANSSGFFGLSDLDDSSVNFENTPQRTPKPVLEATPSQPSKDAPNKAIREEELGSSEYTTCPPSVISVGSVDGKDAELHSPVTSPHSSTSGNISDLSDSSFNISDFLGEKTDNSKKMPPKDETQGHDEDQGHLEKQGQVGRVFTNGEAKENVEPLNWNNNNNNSTRRIQNIDEHIPESDSQLNQGSNHSSTSCSQQSGESTKPAETYISLIAKALLSRENRRMMLHEIYDKIMDVHEYYRTSKKEAWRNAVRHNLSVNECFIKVGKADTGRGFFWTIHPACVQQFMVGDFQRREARRKVKDMEDKEAAKAVFVSRMAFPFPPHPMYPNHLHQLPPPRQHHHANMMYHHQGYHPAVPGQLQALNHRAEVLNGNGNQPIRTRIPLIPNSMHINSTAREQHRYQPYYHPASNHRQMAPARTDRKLRDLEVAPPNVTVNSLGLFIRNGPLRR